MGRRKFRLAWIEDHNARKASLRKRREGLKKIVQELSILCGVDAGVIVFSPGEQQPIVWPEFQAIRDIFNRYMDIPDMYRDLNGRNTEVNLQKLLGKLYEMVIKLRSRNDTAALSLLSYQIEQGSREAASLEMNELNAMLAWAPEKLAEINKFLEEAGGAEVEGLASNQAAGGADAALDDRDRDSCYLNLMSQRNNVARSSVGVAGVNIGIGSGTNNPDQASQAVGTDLRNSINIYTRSRMTEIEAPFRPHEKLLERQKYFQNIHNHTYLKGRYDKITSVAIPLALAGSCLFLIGRGIYNMSHGIGKKE
ncbi:hypothetical protein ACFE04_005269 [Oxalis oulophora]